MKKGFTLIELAIVMLIIGLLVGGILAGQELIKQAQIHKTISELENLNRAWKTFYLRYNGIPGDLRNPERFFSQCDASAYGAGANITGNGNKVIDLNENYCIWRQLVMSELYIAKGPKKDSIQGGQPIADINFSDGDAWQFAIWPTDKNIPMVVINYGTNLLHMVNYTGAGVFTPEYMLSFDIKIDDGKPKTGIWNAWGGPACYTHAGGDVRELPSTASEYDINRADKGCIANYIF